MADHRHKRDTDARRKPRAAIVAAPLALLATACAVSVGVLTSNPDAGRLLATSDAASISGAAGTPAAGEQHRSDGSDRSDHGDVASRSESRVHGAALQAAFDRSVSRTATYRAVSDASTRLWTTTVLNLWTTSADDASRAGEIEAGKRVLVTGRHTADRQEIVVDGQSRWVTSGYLSEDQPTTAAAGLSMDPCPDPSVESGLTDSAVYLYRSVCHAFPQITSYGGWDAHGEHSSGKALDVMTTDKALGDTIAAYLQQHAAELHLYDIIWWDRIWTPVRASEGWRAYGDHGSPTANHMDHVHVSTY